MWCVERLLAPSRGGVLLLGETRSAELTLVYPCLLYGPFPANAHPPGLASRALSLARNPIPIIRLARWVRFLALPGRRPCHARQSTWRTYRGSRAVPPAPRSRTRVWLFAALPDLQPSLAFHMLKTPLHSNEALNRGELLLELRLQRRPAVWATAPHASLPTLSGIPPPCCSPTPPPPA